MFEQFFFFFWLPSSRPTKSCIETGNDLSVETVNPIGDIAIDLKVPWERAPDCWSDRSRSELRLAYHPEQDEKRIADRPTEQRNVHFIKS